MKLTFFSLILIAVFLPLGNMALGQPSLPEPAAERPETPRDSESSGDGGKDSALNHATNAVNAAARQAKLNLLRDRAAKLRGQQVAFVEGVQAGEVDPYADLRSKWPILVE